MNIHVTLDRNNMIPDDYTKYAPRAYRYAGTPTVSFPIQVTDIPADARGLAILFLDFDSISVCGFPWIHWSAYLSLPKQILNDSFTIPENASNRSYADMVQGFNSMAAHWTGDNRSPRLVCRYNGPQPPDKTHVYTLLIFALDSLPRLPDGFWANELIAFVREHCLARAEAWLPARA